MKTRTKKVLIHLATRDEAEAAMNELALATNNKLKLTARLDAYMLECKQRYESDFSALDQTINSRRDALQAWAEANPAEFPKDRKSIKLLAGTLGFRTGTPKLALLSRAFSWEAVLGLVKERLPGFVRVKEEVDKEGLLAANSQQQLAGVELSQVGCKITQDESFFADPDLTHLEPRQTA